MKSTIVQAEHVQLNSDQEVIVPLTAEEIELIGGGEAVVNTI